MRVMIVEDNVMISDLLEEGLVDAGYAVCGVARTVSEAVRLGRGLKPDVAILDIDLADAESGTSVPARMQASWRIGYLFASGTGRLERLGDIGASGLLMKPYSVTQMTQALEIVADVTRCGWTLRRLPENFNLLRRAVPQIDVRRGDRRMPVHTGVVLAPQRAPAG